jgi:predicted SnoaL-like aldol condensation-catalyzing enzyme
VKTNVNMRDADSDGVPNHEDADYSPAQDGNGRLTNDAPQDAQTGARQGQLGIHEPGTGLANPELKEAGQGTGQGLQQQENDGQGKYRFKNPVVEGQIAAMQQEQTVAQELIEKNAQLVSGRNGLVKFFVGSTDEQLVAAMKSRLAQHEEKIQQLQVIEAQTTDAADKLLLTEQLQSMEQVGAQLKTAIAESNNNAFSLFGWAFKLFN